MFSKIKIISVVISMASLMSSVASAQLTPGNPGNGGGNGRPPTYNPCDVPTDPNCRPGHNNPGYPGNNPGYPGNNPGYPSNPGYGNSQPRQVCLDAAYNYRYHGYNIDPYTWCSDVYSMDVAICREGGLDYLIRGGRDLQVKSWCSDVQTVSEARCRSSALREKLYTGYPVNVKSYCRGY